MRKLINLTILIFLLLFNLGNAYPFAQSGYLQYHEITDMPPSGCITLQSDEVEWVLQDYGSLSGLWGKEVMVYGDFSSGITVCLGLMPYCCVTVDSVVAINFQNPPNTVPLSSPATVILIALCISAIGITAYFMREKWAN